MSSSTKKPKKPRNSAALQSAIVKKAALGINSSKKGSSERRVLMALLCSTLSRTEVYAALAMNRQEQAGPSALHRDCAEGDNDVDAADCDEPDSRALEEVGGEVDGDRAAIAARSGNFKARYAAAVKDWREVEEGNELRRNCHFRSKIGNDALEDAVRFILEDVQVLSWGTKDLEVAVDDDEGGERVEKVSFPGLTRKRSAEEMFKGYCAWIAGSTRERCNNTITFSPVSVSQPLGRSSFLKLVKHLTKRQRVRKGCVDYVLGSLVYDNFTLLRQVAEDKVQDRKQRAEIIAALDAAEQHLKFSYLTQHVGIDSDAMHDRKFALCAEKNPTDARVSQCKQCLAPFQILAEFRAACGGDNPEEQYPQELSDVFENAEDMLLKFYGHQHRVRNQQDRISELFDEVKRDPTQAVVLIDYKMKFESIRFREKTSEFFGKRGCSWHGAVVFFGTGQGGLQQLYFDQLSSNDSMQDTFAVASMCDVICRRISIDLTHVRSLHFLSDNARCYQNLSLPVMLPFVVGSHENLTLRTFIHSETQDGKSLVDAHFAVAMTHINRYVENYGENVITPFQVVAALNCNGGLANTVAELVSVNRESPGIRRWAQCVAQKKLQKFGRINEFQYSPQHTGIFRVKAFELSGFQFKELVFSRSGSKFASGNAEVQEDGNASNHVDAGDGFRDEDGLEDDDRDGENGEQEETGVTVRTTASLRRVIRINSRRRERDAEAMQDIMGELNVLGANCDIENEEISGTCKYCLEKEFSPQELRRHLEKCCTERAAQITIQSATIAKRLISNGETRVHWDTGESPSLAPFAAHVTQAVREKCIRSSGWACRPAYGQSFGKNTTRKYGEELLAFFKRGARDKRKKIGAPEMLERLKRKYPGKYDLPSEIHVTQFISGLNARWKKLQEEGRGISELALSSGSERSGRMPANYVHALKILVEERNGKIMPREGYEGLLQKMGLNVENVPNDFPTKKQVCSKVSALKRAFTRQ